MNTGNMSMKKEAPSNKNMEPKQRVRRWRPIEPDDGNYEPSNHGNTGHNSWRKGCLCCSHPKPTNLPRLKSR